MGQRHDLRSAIEQHIMVIKRWVEYVQDRKIGFKPIVSLVLPKGSKQRVEGLVWLSESDQPAIVRIASLKYRIQVLIQHTFNPSEYGSNPKILLSDRQRRISAQTCKRRHSHKMVDDRTHRLPSRHRRKPSFARPPSWIHPRVHSL
jgi:hypothetical protein